MGSTILLADKSVTIQKIVELTFADDAYVIKCYSDGEAALAAVPQLRPDLILADISLPLQSGYELCQTLRNDPQYADFSALPVVLLAGIYETMDEDRARAVEERAQQAGASEVLSKPFDPQVLTAKVKHYLQEGQAVLLKDETPTVIEQAPRTLSQNLFTESFQLPPVTAPTFQEAPEDDSERTMMLPRSALVDSNLFADTPAGNEPILEPNAQQTAPDIGSMSVADEPVFEADVDSSENQEESGALSMDAPTEPSIPFARQQPADEPPTIILPTSEEPFGDVFEEQTASSQWSAQAPTEEETPFGAPEPVIPAAAEPESEEQDAADGKMTFAVQDVMSSDEPALHAFTTPAAAEEAAAPAEESYGDTWPGVIMHSGQPVEELFESESAAAVSPHNLIEDEVAEGSAVSNEPAHTSGNAAPVQITDDLVDKIAERVVTKLSERLVSEIVWQVVPDLAEKMIRRELEKLHANEE